MPSEVSKKINELKTKQNQTNIQKKKKKVAVNEHYQLLNTKPSFVAEHMNWRNLMKSFPKNISKFEITLTLI